MNDETPIRQLNQQILSILAFYRTASEEDKTRFEADFKDQIAALDPRSKTMFDVILKAAKAGKTLEQTFSDLEKLK